MDIPNQEIVAKLSLLKDEIHKERKTLLAKRLTKNPFVTDIEYFLGAFMEMYEPHLFDVVKLLFSKGYIVDVSSGFSGKSWELQSLNGYITADYITRNKLAKIDIKFREFAGLTSLAFWPTQADLNKIKAKFMQIAEILPDKGTPYPSQNGSAVAFRMKYIPKDKELQKKRLFERLLHTVQKETKNDLKNRKDKNLHPNKTELTLGTFVEELEIQTRAAVLLLTKKGYSIDFSGFMDDPSTQMLEGDFQIPDKVADKLKELNVAVETNASGYTRLFFSPKNADIKEIIKYWMKIATLLPEMKESAAPSMTKKARDFRNRYSSKN